MTASPESKPAGPNPARTSTARAATATAAVTLVLAACSGERPIGSSDRGEDASLAGTSVDSAYLVPRFVPGSCAVQVGDDADLRFTVTNTRDTQTEKLVSIAIAEADTVRITPPPPIDIAPGQTVAADREVLDAVPVTVVVTGLADTARPGTSVDVDFGFALSGELGMPVPVEACPTQQ